MIYLALFEESWLNVFTATWGLLGILILIGGAIILLMSKKREEVTLIESKRADANANLLKTRDIELEDKVRENALLKEKLEKTEIELEDITAEYRTLAGIVISELMMHWQVKLEIEAKMLRLEKEIRVLRTALEGEEK